MDPLKEKKKKTYPISGTHFPVSIHLFPIQLLIFQNLLIISPPPNFCPKATHPDSPSFEILLQLILDLILNSSELPATILDGCNGLPPQFSLSLNVTIHLWEPRSWDCLANPLRHFQCLSQLTGPSPSPWARAAPHQNTPYTSTFPRTTGTQAAILILPLFIRPCSSTNSLQVLAILCVANSKLHLFKTIYWAPPMTWAVFWAPETKQLRITASWLSRAMNTQHST